MERIKQLLAEKGKTIAENRIQEKINEYGLEEVTEADAKAIVEELEPEAISSLTVSTGKTSTTTTKRQTQRRKNAKQVSLQEAIVHAAKETETELKTLEGTLKQHKDKYVEHRTTAIVNEIRNTSTEIVSSVTERLMEEQADVDSFRTIGEQLGASIFPSFEYSEA